MESKKEEIKMTCEHCNYTWITKSKHIYVTCPSCMAKIKIRDISEHE